MQALKAELKASVTELYKLHNALFEDVQQMKKLLGGTAASPNKD